MIVLLKLVEIYEAINRSQVNNFRTKLNHIVVAVIFKELLFRNFVFLK